MTFLKYIEDRIKDEEEFDVAIGGVDMPATLGFCSNWVITDYCKDKYGELLNSKIIVHIDMTGRYTDSIEVLYDDAKIGSEFCLAVAGYVSESEWDKLFDGGNKV